MKTELTRIDEGIFLKNRIGKSELFCEGKRVSCQDILDAIENKTLLLQAIDDDGTKVITNSDFEEIKKVIPWLFKIVRKPRSFIRSYEEKVPVETAKRINFKAISILSRDSNDWYDRTILTVKAKNIVSDISEETFDIYENRFIVCLIDKMIREVVHARLLLENQINVLGQSQRQVVISRYIKYSSFPKLSKLESGQMLNAGDSSLAMKLKGELEDVKKVESKLGILRTTELYKELHKRKKVKNPIQKTNILTFDYAYNQAYKLWLYLDKIHYEKAVEKEINATQEELQDYYSMYSLFCIIFALNDMGFEIRKDQKFYIDGNGKLKANGKIEFSREQEAYHDVIDLDYLNNGWIRLSYLLDEKYKKWESIEFVPEYLDFEEMGRAKVEEETERILLGLRRSEDDCFRIAFVSIDLARCSEGNRFSDKVYKRFFSYGNYFDDSDQEILKKCGNYKAGLAILGPSDLRSNLLKIEKIINCMMIHHKVMAFKGKEMTCCPICGDKNIKQIGFDSYVCNKCGHRISINYCSNCDENHAKPIVWIKYGDDKFLDDRSFVEGDGNVPGLNELPIYEQERQIEVLMGEYATTAFALEKENTGWKLKTICPNCGVELGVVKEKVIDTKVTWHDTRRKK